jgi:hypothetical protein
MIRIPGTTILLAGAAVLALAGCDTLRLRKPMPAPLPPPVAEKPPEPAPPPVIRPPAPPPPPPARSCVPRSLGPAPRYPDSDVALKNAAGAADRYQLMAAGRLMRQRRLAELERVITGCR